MRNSRRSASSQTYCTAEHSLCTPVRYYRTYSMHTRSIHRGFQIIPKPHKQRDRLKICNTWYVICKVRNSLSQTVKGIYICPVGRITEHILLQNIFYVRISHQKIFYARAPIFHKLSRNIHEIHKTYLIWSFRNM